MIQKKYSSFAVFFQRRKFYFLIKVTYYKKKSELSDKGMEQDKSDWILSDNTILSFIRKIRSYGDCRY